MDDRWPLSAEFPPIHPVTSPYAHTLKLSFEVREGRPLMWVHCGTLSDPPTEAYEIDRNRVAAIRDWFTKLLAEYPPLHEFRGDVGGFGQMTGWSG